MIINYRFIVDGFARTKKQTNVTISSSSELRVFLTKVLSDLRRFTIHDRVHCNRYKDGHSHDIALFVCNRYLRYDVDTNSYSCTEHVSFNDKYIIYDFGCIPLRDFIKLYMLPYLQGYCGIN